MEIYQVIFISLQIMNVISKKKYVSSSDESIENLLYFRDCQRSKDDKASTAPPAEKLVSPPKPTVMDCPYPKMCCSLTCGGNECGAPSPFFGHQMENMQRNQNQNFPPIKPMPGPMPGQMSMQSPVQPQAMVRNRKKKVKPPMRIQMQPPIGSRRDFGFTKDRIKNLINQDDDIRKILKDLVRVTMQKVDLVEMINSRKADVSLPPQRSTPHVVSKARTQHDDDYDDLE